MSTNNHHSTGDQNDSDRAKLEQVLAASEDSEHANVASIHEHVAELLGAYAIHAVAEAEIEFVELHLDQCETCQVELAEHLATAARIGAAPISFAAASHDADVYGQWWTPEMAGCPAD